MASKASSNYPPSAEGIVIRSVGSSSRVQFPSGKQLDCIIRGKFRIKGLNTTNPVAVGDKVEVHLDDDETGVITKILPRKNYLLRKAISQTNKVHILAANIDQAILLFTIDYPPTTTGFANRFLVTAEGYHIPACIIINKIDLIETAEQKEKLAEITEIYSEIGYPVMHINAKDPAYKQSVSDLLKNKISFIGGHSGAGKSTLVNLIDPNLEIKTAQVSDYSRKGRHTTTFAEMHPLSFGGYLIDSPGIKEMGMVAFERSDLSHYFPEMLSRLQDCKFNDCTHTREPACAIKEALERNEIHHTRYESYIRMLEEIEEENTF